MDVLTWIPAPRMDQETVGKILFYVLLLVSLSFHEYGHAWSAKKLGDDTAEQMGRLSLNPLVHIDLFFTVLLPLYFLFFAGFTNGIFFCAAKPVPVNPWNLRKPTRDMMLTSAAGPAMNVALALFFTAAYWFHIKVRGIPNTNFSSDIIREAIVLNLMLAVFNMIPIPPLDGHRVLGYFLPANLRAKYYEFGRYGMVALLLLLATGKLGQIVGPALHGVGMLWNGLMPPGFPLFDPGR